MPHPRDWFVTKRHRDIKVLRRPVWPGRRQPIGSRIVTAKRSSSSTQSVKNNKSSPLAKRSTGCAVGQCSERNDAGSFRAIMNQGPRARGVLLSLSPTVYEITVSVNMRGKTLPKSLSIFFSCSRNIIGVRTKMLCAKTPISGSSGPSGALSIT